MSYLDLVKEILEKDKDLNDKDVHYTLNELYLFGKKIDKSFVITEGKIGNSVKVVSKAKLLGVLREMKRLLNTDISKMSDEQRIQLLNKQLNNVGRMVALSIAANSSKGVINKIIGVIS